MDQRKNILHDLALLMAISVLLVSAAAAWFITRETADTAIMGVSAAHLADGGISADGFDYSADGDIDLETPVGLEMKQVSGNGCALYLPETDPMTGEVLYQDGKWVAGRATPNADYFTQDLYIRGDRQMTLFLEGSSTVTAVRKEETVYDISEFPAGIVRVAFLNVSDENEESLLAIWMPNSCYQLTRSETIGWELNKNGTPETDWSYYNGNEVVSVSGLTAEGIPCGDFFRDGSAETQRLVPLSQTEDEDYPWKAHIKVVVWLEGLDRDALAPKIGGTVKMDLRFRLSPDKDLL